MCNHTFSLVISAVENLLEIQSSRLEIPPPIKIDKIDEIVLIKEERDDQIVVSPSMKPTF